MFGSLRRITWEKDTPSSEILSTAKKQHRDCLPTFIHKPASYIIKPPSDSTGYKKTRKKLKTESEWDVDTPAYDLTKVYPKDGVPKDKVPYNSSF